MPTSTAYRGSDAFSPPKLAVGVVDHVAGINRVGSARPEEPANCRSAREIEGSMPCRRLAQRHRRGTKMASPFGWPRCGSRARRAHPVAGSAKRITILGRLMGFNLAEKRIAKIRSWSLISPFANR
jgi:hypothetical protein